MKGYVGATVRGIAARAAVDPSLVHHYFGTKRELFAAVVGLPFDPRAVVDHALGGDPAGAGSRIVSRLLVMWETDGGVVAVQSLLRSALSDEQLMRLLQEFVVDDVLVPVTRSIAEDHHRMRAALLASQIIGLATVRYVMGIEPLASASPEEVVEAVGPVLQHYLTGDLARS